MSKAKTYTVNKVSMTVNEISTATGVSAGGIRLQMSIKGIKDIKKAVENASKPEQKEAVKKLFGTVKAKASVTPKKSNKGRAKLEEQRVTVDIMAGTYTIVRRATDTEKYKKGTIQIFKGTKANPKCAIKGSSIKFLKSVISEKKLPISLEHSKKSSINTRQLGKDIINALTV